MAYSLHDDPNSFWYFVRNTILIVIVLLGFTSSLTHDPPPTDIPARIKAAELAGNEAELVRIYESQLGNDPYNLDYLCNYIKAVASLPRIHSYHKDYVGHPDPKQSKTRDHFEQWTASTNPKQKDLGYFCVGLLAAELKQYDDAYNYLINVRSRDFKHYYNTLGHVQLRRGLTAEAEDYFRRELALGGDVKGATRNLARLLADSQRLTDLYALTRDPVAAPHVPAFAMRLVHLYRAEWGSYLAAIVRPVASHFNLISLFGALAGAVVWYFFLRWIDVFEPEKHRYLLLVFLGGAASTFLATGIYDTLQYFGLRESGMLWGDLMYCIGGIGFVEEFAKLIPFLVILFLTDQCNESVDYVVYASISALGFATMENVLYIDRLGSHVIVARTMISATLHMVDTSIIAYGLLLAYYRNWGSFIFNLPGFFLLAMLFHGLFDYPLVSDAMPPEFRVLPVLFAIVGFEIYAGILSNAISQSWFFDKERSIAFSKLGDRLGYALIGIASFEYVLLSIQAGPTLARREGLHMFFLLVFLLFRLCYRIGLIDPEKGKWSSIYEPDESERHPSVPDLMILLPRRQASACAKIERLSLDGRRRIMNFAMKLHTFWPCIALMIAVMLVPASFVMFIKSLAHGVIALGVITTVVLALVFIVVRRRWHPYLRERAERIISSRIPRVVNPADPDSLFVEVVPRRNWRRIMLEPAADLGFLSTTDDHHILFEGDHERCMIPVDSITSIKVEPDRPLKRPNRMLLVLTCRTDSGEREYPIRIRSHNCDYEGNPDRYKEDELLTTLAKKIRRIFPDRIPEATLSQ